MIRDVKSILTKTAFNIPPHLIGRSLATPKRRLAALTTDFLLASILSEFSGINLLIVVSIAFILPSFVKSLKRKLKRKTRIVLLISGIILLIGYMGTMVGKGLIDRYIIPIETGKFNSVEDSIAVGKVLGKITFEMEKDTTAELKESIDELEQTEIGQKILSSLKIKKAIEPDSLHAKNKELIKNFATAYIYEDSLTLAQYWSPMKDLIAGETLQKKNETLTLLSENIDSLETVIEDQAEQLSDPSFGYIVKAAMNDIGFSFGWYAFYFIFCWFLFDGKSPGKKLFHIQIIRMNGHDLKLWYCFERFAGYAAGVATGLLGFLQIYWDDNRQCIHDKIASTVVIDLKPKKRRK